MKNRFASKKDGIIWAGVAIMFILLAVFVSVTCAIVVTFFLVGLLLAIDSAVPLAIALTLLLLCPVLLALEQRSGAKLLANWAYYFFAIGVVLQIIDFMRSGAKSRTT